MNEEWILHVNPPSPQPSFSPPPVPEALHFVKCGEGSLDYDLENCFGMKSGLYTCTPSPPHTHSHMCPPHLHIHIITCTPLTSTYTQSQMPASPPHTHNHMCPPHLHIHTVTFGKPLGIHLCILFLNIFFRKSVTKVSSVCFPLCDL